MEHQWHGHSAILYKWPLGWGWGDKVHPKGNQSLFMALRVSVTYPGENNVVQVLWLHVSENTQSSPAQQGYCYIDRAPVQNGKGPPPQFELNFIFLIYLGTLASHRRCAQQIPVVVSEVFRHPLPPSLGV